MTDYPITEANLQPHKIKRGYYRNVNIYYTPNLTTGELSQILKKLTMAKGRHWIVFGTTFDRPTHNMCEYISGIPYDSFTRINMNLDGETKVTDEEIAKVSDAVMTTKPSQYYSEALYGSSIQLNIPNYGKALYYKTDVMTILRKNAWGISCAVPNVWMIDDGETQRDVCM